MLKNAMALTREELLRVATLARLRLAPQEEEQLVNQLDNILQYMEKLNQIDTKEIEPFIHTVDPANSLREDCVTNQPSAEGILANAPARKETFFQVPKILE
jgi:aspartyl-tRNA(Asn)/glutamyl-tRNA(Gln) amidotransferase subunit C